MGAQDYHDAKKLGTVLAKNGYGVLTGGSCGTMEAANKGCFEHGCHSVGVTLELPFSEQKPNEYLDEFYRYKDFYPRLNKYRNRSSYQVACPGGIGTIMEIFDALGMILTGKADKGNNPKHQKQIILQDREFYQGLVDWLWAEPVRRGYISPETMKMIKITDNAEETLKEIQKGTDYDPANLGKKLDIKK